MAHVLVVDDDPSTVYLLELTLELEGHRASSLTDGRRLLEVMRSMRPEVVLLDAQLPHADGWTLCESIRGDAELADTPVVLLTARTGSDDVERGRQVGADAYVTKPFDTAEVNELVGRLADAGRRPSP